MKHASLNGHKLIILGFGSITPAVLPLILKHIDVDLSQIEVIAASNGKQHLAEQVGIAFTKFKLTQTNYQSFLKPRLNKGDILLNLSFGISSFDLIELCHQQQAMYLDTDIGNWSSVNPSQNSAYESRLELTKKKQQFNSGPTALVMHGANPGLVTHFAKRAVLEVAKKTLSEELINELRASNSWGELAQRSHILAMHMVEKDTQGSASKSMVTTEYSNTWSVDSWLYEAGQNVAFVLGEHESALPSSAVSRDNIINYSRIIELNKRGAEIQVKSFLPSTNIFQGFLILHEEIFALGELFSKANKNSTYQPSIYFVYHPCQNAITAMHDVAMQGWPNSTSKPKRILLDDIVEGQDELGMLIFQKNSPHIYWFGSRLSIHEARRLAVNNNATTLQVSAGILAGLVWIIKNPQSGLIEPEQVNFEQALEIANPYLGTLEGCWTTWPNSSIKQSTINPWQLSEFLVSSL